MSIPAQPDVMTLKEAADYLRVSERHVQRMARRGEIPALKVGYLWRFKRTALDAMFQVSSPTEEEQ